MNFSDEHLTLLDQRLIHEQFDEIFKEIEDRFDFQRDRYPSGIEFIDIIVRHITDGRLSIQSSINGYEVIDDVYDAEDPYTDPLLSSI